MKILLIEDEEGLAEAIAEALKRGNYSCDACFDGEYGLDCALTGMYDLIILDITLPKKDGFQVLKELRAANIASLVLVLSARDTLDAKVAGLDWGADDYMSKPFHVEELLARLRALIRRRGESLEGEPKATVGDITFYPMSLSIQAGGETARLTKKESQLLEILISSPGIVSKEAILNKLWGYDSEPLDSNAEIQASLLRKKLKSIGSSVQLKAIRGIGYYLEAPNAG